MANNGFEASSVSNIKQKGPLMSRKQSMLLARPRPRQKQLRVLKWYRAILQPPSNLEPCVPRSFSTDADWQTPFWEALLLVMTE
jgi:hypothetical protein